MRKIKKLLCILFSICLVVGLVNGVQVTTKADDGDYDSDYYYYDQDEMEYYNKYELHSKTKHVYANEGDKVNLSTYLVDNDGNKLDNPGSKFYFKWYKCKYGIEFGGTISKTPNCIIQSVDESDFQTQNGEGTYYFCEIYIKKNSNEEDADFYDSIEMTISNKESKNYYLEDNSNNRGEEDLNEKKEGFIEYLIDEGTKIDFSPDVIDDKCHKVSALNSKFSFKWFKCKIGLNENNLVATSTSYTINSIAKSDYYADSDDANERGTYYKCKFYVDGVLTDYILYGLCGYGSYQLHSEDDIIYANIGDSVKLDTYVEKYMKGRVDSNNSRFSYNWEKTVYSGTRNYTSGFGEDLGVHTSSYTINSLSKEDYAFVDDDSIGDDDPITDTRYTCTLYVDGEYMSVVEFRIKPMTSEGSSYYLESEETTKYVKAGNQVTLSASVKKNDKVVNANNSRFSFEWYRYRYDEKDSGVLSTKSDLVINSFDEDDFNDTGGYETCYVCELFVDGKSVSSETFYVMSEYGMYQLYANGGAYIHANIGDEALLSTSVTCNDVVVDSNDSKFSYKWYKVTDNYNDIRSKLNGNSSNYTVASVSNNDYYNDDDECPLYECELYVNGVYARSTYFYIYPEDGSGDESSNINVGNTWILKEGVVQSNLPNGIEYDKETNTLILNSYDDEGKLYDETDPDEPYLLPHWWGSRSSILADGDLKISVKGTNTLSGTISSTGKLSISGKGTININSSEDSAYGISAVKKIDINETSVNINGNTKNESFYGIGLDPWTGYGSDFYTGGECYIRFTDSNINISNSVTAKNSKNAITNVGIDAQDADLIINNSKVNVELTHGWNVGYGAGLYSGLYDKSFGGKFSIDNNSIVRFNATDSDVPDHIYATYYYEDDIDGEYYYTGLKSPGINTTKRQAVLYKSKDISGRKECKDAFMEITPIYRESDYSSVSSGDDSGDQQNETTQPTSDQNETTTADNHQTQEETTGNSDGEQVTTGTPVIVVPTTKASSTPSGSSTKRRSYSYSYSSTPKKTVKLSLKVRKRTVRAKKLRKRKVVVKNAIKARLGSYKLHYFKVSGSSRLDVNKKGHIIVRKKTKKGTYKIRVNIWSFNTGGSCDKYVTVRIRVK